MIQRLLLIGLFLVFPSSTCAAGPALYQIGSQVPVSGSGDAHVVGRSVRSENLQGDLVALGREVTVEDTLQGDLLSLSRTLRVNGRLLDDARVIAEYVVIAGEIRGHFLAAGRTVTVTPEARIGDVAAVIGKTVDLRGHFEKLVYVLGDAVTISGTYDGDVIVLARSVLTLDPGTVVRGTLRLSVRPGAVVSVPETLPRVIGKPMSSEDWARFFLRIPLPRVRLAPFLSLWVIGVLFILLRPREALLLQEAIRAAPLSSVIHGFLAFLAAGALILAAFLPFFLLSAFLALALLLFLAVALGLGPIALASIVPAEDWQSLLLRYSAASLLLFLGYALVPLSTLALSFALALCMAGAALRLIVSGGRSGFRA